MIVTIGYKFCIEKDSTRVYMVRDARACECASSICMSAVNSMIFLVYTCSIYLLVST